MKNLRRFSWCSKAVGVGNALAGGEHHILIFGESNTREPWNKNRLQLIFGKSKDFGR